MRCSNSETPIFDRGRWLILDQLAHCPPNSDHGQQALQKQGHGLGAAAG
jgi:hypothetical protein